MESLLRHVALARDNIAIIREQTLPMHTSQPTLSNKAFGEHADSRLIIAFSAYQAARRHLSEALDQAGGCALIEGPAGSGKTTTIREHAAWSGRQWPVAVLNGAGISPRQLVSGMLAQFGLGQPPPHDEQVLSALNRFLGEQAPSGKVPVLYVDNFDRTTASTRRLLNWLAALEEHGTPALRFVLTGAEDLSVLLRDHSVRALGDRMPAPWAINPLSQPETFNYLRTKWIAAGGADSVDAMFPAAVCARLHAESRGRPGVLDQLAFEAAADAADAEAPTPSVVLTRDGETVSRYPLTPRSYLIGRSELADIRIDDNFVSNVHALLQVYRNAIILFDLNSTNGTTVNSIEVQKRLMRSDDVITIGHHRLKIRNAPPVSEEINEQIEATDTVTLKNLADIRRVRARHTIAALKRK